MKKILTNPLNPPYQGEISSLPDKGGLGCLPLQIKNSRGSTLIEMLLYMGIFAILLVVLTQIFSAIIDVQLESESTSVVSQDAKFLLARLNYDIQQSQNVLIPSSLGSQASTLQITSASTNYTYGLS